MTRSTLGRSNHLDRALERNSGHQCECRACHRPRFKLSRFCKDHAANHARTGDPVALSIRPYTWRPFYLRSHAFVVAQLRVEHRSIEQAVRWVAAELARAEQPTSFDPAYLGYATSILRAKNNGVSPVDFVARAITPYLADNRDHEVGPLFASDGHFAHQAAQFYLRAHPIGTSGWSRRTRQPQGPSEVSRIRWRVRVHTHQRVAKALGVLALKAAIALHLHHSRESTHE